MKQANGQKPVSRVRASVVLSIASVVFTGLTVLSIWLMWRYMDDPTKVREIIGDHYVLGALCMILISAVQVVVALIPGELVEISAGYVFGAWGGALLCLAGTTLGSVLVLLLVRRFGGRFVYAFYPKEKIDALPILRNPKKRNLLTLVLFLLPGTPKDLLTYGIGLTDMSIPSYLALTTVARFPSVITSTVGGNAVGEKKYLWAVAVFLVTAAISLAGLCLYNRIGKRHAQACAEDAGQAQPRRVFRRSHLRDRCFRRKSDRTP